MKKILTFLVILIPWFISGILFSNNTNFYNSINVPSFTPPPIVFIIIWPILYILISISVYMIVTKYSISNEKQYYKTLLYNYIFNQLYTFLFFKLNNIFLSFIDTLLILLTSLFLYYETKELDKKASKFLIPYIFWNIFAFILILATYFMNI